MPAAQPNGNTVVTGQDTKPAAITPDVKVAVPAQTAMVAAPPQGNKATETTKQSSSLPLSDPTAAAGNADARRRRELLERSERLMLTDYPLVPLYFFVSKRLIKPYVQGVVANPMNHIRSQALTMQAR